MLENTDTKNPSPTQKNFGEHSTTYLEATNCRENDGAPSIPKRKLSVFYRSFDVVASSNQDGERETIEVRRSLNSSPGGVDKQYEKPPRGKQMCNQTNSTKQNFLYNCHLPVENIDSTSSSSPAHFSQDSSTTTFQKSLPKITSFLPTTVMLPRVTEDRTVDDYNTSIRLSNEGHVPTASTEHEHFKEGTKKDTVPLDENYSRPDKNNIYFVESTAKDIIEDKTLKFCANVGSNCATINSKACTIPSYTTSCKDPVKSKDSEYPRSFVATSTTDRLERDPRRLVDVEMSSREDSSIGSESENDSTERRSVCASHAQSGPEQNEKTLLESNFPYTPSSFLTSDVSRQPELAHNHVEEKTGPVVDLQTKRQKFSSIRKSLSEGDTSGRDSTKCRCRYTKRLTKREEQFQIFPSLTDRRLRETGLANVGEIDTLYREHLPEHELERKYTAFSIGLSTDRITLNRRMALSLRQRDLSEQNLTCEIQRMEQDIQELSPLCTDRESIEKVERIRHRLDMVARCTHRISCVAETLGAVHQEHRISKAISIADRYLQMLRTRCENLCAEVAETKRILLKNNIMIEEHAGELGDDLPRIRYRSGLPTNNRMMIARRRASIATISRPLATSQDIIKESPRQRNSVSGRVTLRRPSLCIEAQKWEKEKLDRADSSSSVGELRDIFEQAESRRDSLEENNNVLRINSFSNADALNCSASGVVKEETWMDDKQNSISESSVSKNVGRELKLCIKTAEPLRIPRQFMAWQSILWCILIFFLGFYVKYVVSLTKNCVFSLKQ